MTHTEDFSRTPPELPKQIGQYRIEKVLGVGGMGTVYLGTHIENGRLAAIKMLPPSMAHEEGFVARFGREILAMKHLQSSHIVELYESGEDLGTYYYAMEYVPGETLTERLRREQRIPWREAIDIAVQVCQALKAAHNAGIVHRDLKPSNLLITPDGTVKLSDFGIAQVFASSKLTVTGGILGTAEFMSPEQAQGRRANKQSDIYSLGAVLYVMLTGRPPFTGKTTLDVIQKHKFSQFDSPKRIVPEIPFWLDEVVCKCLSKKTEDRYPDAYVLKLRLQEITKKLELKNSGHEVESAPPEALTATDATRGGTDVHIGSTLARDLFRMQAEVDGQPSMLARWFDNVWILVALLMLILAGTYFLMKSANPGPEQMFAKGVQLLERPEGPEWDKARDQFFLPLLEKDPEAWSSKVEPYLAKIQMYELKRKFLGRTFHREPLPRSEPEAVLRQVLDMRQQGRTSEAAAKLAALEILIRDQPEQAPLLAFVGKLQEELTKQEPLDRFEYVSTALARAQELLQSGKIGDAQAVWRSVVALYDADPAASKFVEEARRALSTSEASPNESRPNLNQKE